MSEKKDDMDRSRADESSNAASNIQRKNLFSSAIQIGILQSLIISVVPLFFGSFLFVGIIESYKNDLSVRNNIIADAYRPMRETHALCHETQNKLVIQYSQVAGSYKIMMDEITQSQKNGDINFGGNNANLLLHASFKANQSSLSGLDKLETDFVQCRTKLFRQYEELALMTGTYEIFKIKSKARMDKLNKLYEERKEKASKVTNGVEVEDIINKMRLLLRMDLSNRNEMNEAFLSMNPLMDMLLKRSLIYSEKEQEMFEVEQAFFRDVYEMYASEINKRFKKGFISNLF